MGALLIPIIVILVLLILGAVWLRRWGARREELTEDLARPETTTLDYHVPDEQDPAVVLAALEADGYVASTDTTDTRLIRIACPAGPDRERARVRSVIETADVTAIEHGAPLNRGPVRFDDER